MDRSAGLYFDKYADAFTTSTSLTSTGLDKLDAITASDLLGREGCARAAAKRFIGGGGSALHVVWHAAILKRRGVPLFPTQVFRLVGGNSLCRKRSRRNWRAGAPRLTGEGDPLRPTRRDGEYSEFGKPKTMDGDYLVCAMSAVMLGQIPVTPAWPEAKRWAIENMPYYSATRPVLQSRTKVLARRRSRS